MVRGFGAWPCPGKAATVLTGRPLSDAPEGVTARSGGADAILAEIDAAARRVWIVGGGVVARDALRCGRLDRLSLTVIPRVLGEGPVLFPDGAPDTGFDLVEATPLARGAVRLVYRR